MRRNFVVIKGERELIRKLKRLGDPRKVKKVMRAGVNAAAQVVVKAVRREWPEDSGLSKRSVAKKILTRGRRGVSALVGIDAEAVGEAHGRRHVPSNIDHLVEFGYQLATGQTVPAVAPLRRGHEASRDQAAERFIEKTKQGIEREAVKR